MWRVYMLSSALAASFPAFAADKNLETPMLNPPQSVCEQLLQNDLAGFYVVSNFDEKQSTLVELHKLGLSGAYVISRARINLPADGYRHLEFERLNEGWLADLTSGKRVGLLSMDRQGRDLLFRFENQHESDQAALVAAPLYGVPQVRGDILSPDSFQITFRNGPSTAVRFTRVTLDGDFERAVTTSLKSLIASRFHDESPGRVDYVMTIETRRPMTSAEVRALLRYEHIVAMEHEEDNQSRHYKFALFLPITGFLESAGTWLRNWEVERFDVVPARGLSEALLHSLADRVRGQRTDEAATLRALQDSLDAVNRTFGN